VFFSGGRWEEINGMPIAWRVHQHREEQCMMHRVLQAPAVRLRNMCAMSTNDP
jgi:hypothetical protein